MCVPKLDLKKEGLVRVRRTELQLERLSVIMVDPPPLPAELRSLDKRRRKRLSLPPSKSFMHSKLCLFSLPLSLCRRIMPVGYCVLLFCVLGVSKESIGDSDAGSNTVATLKFELDIQPILTARGCNAGPCHGKSRGQNGFALSLLGFDANMDFDAIVKNSRGRRVSMASPVESLLLTKATGKSPHGGGVRFTDTDEDYRLLLKWIQQGTARTSESDPKLVSIQITPEPHSLIAGQLESLTVTARYSDGHVRDVTKMCAFQSNEPAVVSVSSNGQLQAGMLPGEGTIMARYMGMIATWSTAVPREIPVPSHQYDSLPRQNFIDGLVYAKLATLNILPSEPCSESQFLRRLYLDAIGRLPSPDEVDAYLADPSPDKKSRWIELVLQRPEYADFWANKWADLLRPNPYRVGIKTTYSLDAWLRDAFRKNLSHDLFARQLITAQGSTWRNGAVTIFRDRREPAEITTMVSQLFLGLRMECAKCHQHPFEIYGQSDFYGMAAHFARVGYKGTGLSPPISGSEEIIFARADGEVRHPLTNQVLQPTPLFGQAIEPQPNQDPRTMLVDWMVDPANPTFSQVAVNRMWAELFGVGIVDPVDDLRATNPASNQPLLSALADYFRSVGYDNKKMLAAIFASHVYQLSSRPNETNGSDHRNFSRHYRKRLRAEVLSDALTDITLMGEDFDGMPVGMRAIQLWTFRTESELLDAFGRPDPNQDPPCERASSATMTQALHLMNASRIQKRITSDGSRCQNLADSDQAPAAIVRELYMAIFSRPPDAAELADLASEFARLNQESAKGERRALIEDIMWSMVNSPEFLYLD